MERTDYPTIKAAARAASFFYLMKPFSNSDETACQILWEKKLRYILASCYVSTTPEWADGSRVKNLHWAAGQRSSDSLECSFLLLLASLPGMEVIRRTSWKKSVHKDSQREKGKFRLAVSSHTSKWKTEACQWVPDWKGERKGTAQFPEQALAGREAGDIFIKMVVFIANTCFHGCFTHF